MACLESLTGPDGPLKNWKKVEARASLVPFQGGQVLMPLGKTFYSPRFGMTADRFGLMWMVIVMES